jgi:hypothetical protein
MKLMEKKFRLIRNYWFYLLEIYIVLNLNLTHTPKTRVKKIGRLAIPK